MSKYPKQFLYYNTMSNILNKTDLIKNIELIYKSHLDENENIRNGKSSNLGKNLFTSQAIEIFREIIVNSGVGLNNGLDENLFKDVIGNYTHSKDILNSKKLNISNKNGRLKGDILHSLVHKQFWYQSLEDDLLNHLNYTLNYYTSVGFDKYINTKIGIDLEKLLIVGFIIYNMSEKNLYIDLDKNNELYEEEKNVIIREYSIDLFDLRNELIKNSRENPIFKSITELEYYGLGDIFDRPLIKHNGLYMCVFPMLLLNRITNALYHEFDTKFRAKYYGDINENFIVSLFKKLTNSKVIHTKDYEHLYTAHNKPNSPDVIVEESNYTLFVELKSSSINYQSIKNGLCDNDRKKIKENIEQIYKSIICYNEVEEGKSYFGLEKKKNSIIIPIISYVNNPYLSSSDYIVDILDEIISDNGLITKELIEGNPIKIIGNKSIIYLLNIIDKIGLEKFYNYIYSKEYTGWELETIILELLKKEDIDINIDYDYSFNKLVEKELEKYKYYNIKDYYKDSLFYLLIIQVFI